VPFEEEPAKVFAFLLADVEVAEYVVYRLDSYYTADFLELRLEGGFEVEVGVGVIDKPPGEELGIALYEDVLVDETAENVEDVAHLLLEGLLA